MYNPTAVKRILFTSLNKTLSKVRDISYGDAIQLSLFSVFIITIGLIPSIITNSFSFSI